MKPHILFFSLPLILSCLLSGAAIAQFTGRVSYQDNVYVYELKATKPKETYQLLISTTPPQPENRPVYKSLVKISGEVAANKKLVITVLRASIEKGNWVLNRESLLETTFDYGKRKVFRSTKGSFAQFRNAEYAEVVADNVTPQAITTDKAVQYVMEDLIVNYHRILAPHITTGTPEEAVDPKNKLTILPQLAVFPTMLLITENNKNYKINVGAINPENRRQDLHIKIVEQNEAEDAGSTSTLYTSYLIIDDRVAGKGVDWAVRIHYAERTNSFTWQPFPSQFLECKFSSAKGLMTFTPSARLIPFQNNKPPKTERPEGNNGQITKEELLKFALTHFVKYYAKLFTNQ